VSPYIAWKEGLFYFKDWELEEIVTYLSRWYDFDVVYQDKNIQTYRFGGKFDRYGELTSVLNLLKQTGKINVEIDGKTIILRERKVK
jgi:ferric-dicitrate binding protein FerR (iron transport regulator)